MKILTWKVDKTIPTECPDYKPDPYTGEYPMTHCAVYHCKTITEDKTAEFSTENKAREFADKAPLSCYDFKLNGKLLKDKRKKLGNITSISLTKDETITASGTTLLNSLSTNKK